MQLHRYLCSSIRACDIANHPCSSKIQNGIEKMTEDTNQNTTKIKEMSNTIPELVNSVKSELKNMSEILEHRERRLEVGLCNCTI
jgi:hypothetical protein